MGTFKDAQEIRAVLGLALTQRGCYTDAWKLWVEAAQLVAEKCPPFDEALAVYAVQAALCAASVEGDSEPWTLRLLRVAAQLHDGSFGGACPDEQVGAAFFRRRFARELDLTVNLTLDPAI